MLNISLFAQTKTWVYTKHVIKIMFHNNVKSEWIKTDLTDVWCCFNLDENDSIQLILLFHSINSIVFFSTFISLYILAARVCVFVWVWREAAGLTGGELNNAVISLSWCYSFRRSDEIWDTVAFIVQWALLHS